MDQNSAFDLEVKENCPNGVVVYDLFHVLSNFGRKVIDSLKVVQNGHDTQVKMTF